MKASNCVIKINNWYDWSNPIEGIPTLHRFELLILISHFNIEFYYTFERTIQPFWSFKYSSISLWIRHSKTVLQLPRYSLGVINLHNLLHLNSIVHGLIVSVRSSPWESQCTNTNYDAAKLKKKKWSNGLTTVDSHEYR